MARRVYVHTGPTLSAADVRSVIPEAVVLPPVAATDLLRLDLRRGDVVVIVDGYFQQAQAVRHKEILLLLERGVEVWGAGSMGALRAAELHPLGMRGAGAVFRLYTRGVIDGDDEVGVTHGPAERGYPVVADALVNVRCTVRQAVRDGLVSRDDAADFITAAAATPFEQRTPAGLVEAAVAAGVDRAVAERIGTVLVERRVDVKRRDGLRALHRVRRGHAARAGHVAHVVSDNAHLRLWRERSRCSGDVGDATPVTDRAALTAMRLYAADFPAFAAPVALRTLAALVAPEPRVAPSDAELLATVSADSEIGRLLDGGELSPDEVLAHLRREQRIAGALGDARDDEDALTALILRHAGERGLLDDDDDARWQPLWLRSAERGTAEARILAARRALAVAPGIALHDPFVVALKLGGRFAQAREAALTALAFNDEVRAAHPEFDVERIDGARVTAWFAERWQVAAEDVDVELLDRGFTGRRDFVQAARPFYMADKFRGDHRDLSAGSAPSPWGIGQRASSAYTHLSRAG